MAITFRTWAHGCIRVALGFSLGTETERFKSLWHAYLMWTALWARTSRWGTSMATAYPTSPGAVGEATVRLRSCWETATGLFDSPLRLALKSATTVLANHSPLAT